MRHRPTRTSYQKLALWEVAGWGGGKALTSTLPAGLVLFKKRVELFARSLHFYQIAWAAEVHDLPVCAFSC